MDRYNTILTEQAHKNVQQNIREAHYSIILLFMTILCEAIAWYLTFRSIARWKKALIYTANLKLEYQKEIEYARELLAERVKQLEWSNQSLNVEIRERQKAEDVAKLLNDKLLTAARRAGTSDVATSILHNVGNVLNSLNVSLGFLKQQNNKEDSDNLLKVSQLIQDNQHHLADYLTNDAQGKVIAIYLEALAKKIASHSTMMDRELDTMRRSVTHIKHIVSMQNALGGNAKLVSKISLRDVIESSIEMCGNNFAQCDQARE